jgi:hypothetical protein
MINLDASSALFPSFKQSVCAHWAPIILEPISGSYERLVVGVAVVGLDNFHIETANRLDRLRCYYGDGAQAIIFALQLAEEHLRHELSERALDALLSPTPAVSGVYFGECREAEGENLAAIGRSWMSALSSLYSPIAEALMLPEILAYGELGASASSGDRLPRLVMDYVSERRDSYLKFFSSDLRSGRQRRMSGRSHEVMIDFAGSRLVANFGTLKAGGLPGSVNLIKRRLWDLKVERDRDTQTTITRAHEMLIQRPAHDDPQISDKQHSNLSEALAALEEQADQEELRVQAFESVIAIGERVMKAEAA